MRIHTNKITYEDKFGRKYACWANNHHGWRKYKKANRKKMRRRLKDEV